MYNQLNSANRGSTWMVALCLVFMIPSAFAQTANSNDDVIEEVVVYAQKREQTLMEVPQTIQVISGDTLEQRGIRSFSETLKLIPGASSHFSGGASSQGFNFRGTGAKSRVGDSATGFYFDDVPYYVPGSPYGPSLGLFDLESLEVLRSPQGTLYGQGSLGGVMIFRTEKPDFQKITGRVQVSGSEMKEGDNGHQLDGTVSFPLIKDQLALRITAGQEERPGLAESPEFPGDKDLDTSEDEYIRAKLLWEPSDDLSVQAMVWHSEQEQFFTPSDYASNDPPTVSPGTGGVKGAQDFDITLSSLVVNWATDFGTFTSSTSLAETEIEQTRNVVFPSVIPGLGIIEFELSADTQAEAESFNQEFRFASPDDGGPWSWIVGATYTDATNEADSIIEIRRPVFAAGTTVTPSELETEQWAVFGEVSRSFMDDAWNVLFGLRYFEDDRSNLTGSETFDAVSPRFNVSFTPSENALVYLNIAKGFQSGKFTDAADIALLESLGLSASPVLDEVSLWTYEIGARLDLFDGRLHLEPAIYYSEFEDFQSELFIGAAALDFNMDTEVKGIELVMSAILMDGLTLSYSADVNDSEPVDLSPITVTLPTGLQEGDQLPYVPGWSHSVFLDYERSFSGFRLYGQIGWTGQDGQIDIFSGLAADELDTWSARIGIAGDRWNLSIWGDNLTDQKGPIVTAVVPNRFDRREIGVTLGFNF